MSSGEHIHHVFNMFECNVSIVVVCLLFRAGKRMFVGPF